MENENKPVLAVPSPKPATVPTELVINDPKLRLFLYAQVLSK